MIVYTFYLYNQSFERALYPKIVEKTSHLFSALLLDVLKGVHLILLKIQIVSRHRFEITQILKFTHL